MPRPSLRCDWLAVWILWSAWCSAAGWILSWMNQVTIPGYAVTTVLFAAVLMAVRRQLSTGSRRPAWFFRRSTYARHGLPKLWLGLTCLIFAGGLFYHPDNYDYLTYRFPRVLHWSWDHHWSWFPLADSRQNSSAVAMEWLMTPLFVFFRTDRLFFLINFVCYLFLPGLVFGVFRRLGISGRVAWSWMWVLPSGFCFALQAASMGNDMFAATYFLAALYYADRVGSRCPAALCLSLLSISLVTGAKASNLPLVLPWLALLCVRRAGVFGAWRPAFLMLALALAVLASFLPIAVANTMETGSYTGDPHNDRNLQVANPVLGIVGNSVQIATGNFSAPVWFHEIKWPFAAEFRQLFKSDFRRFGMNEVPFQLEENAGVGIGVSVLALAGIFYGIRNHRPWRRSPRWFAFLMTGTFVIAGLGYMAKMGSEAAPRLVAAYYVPGVAALLLLFPVAGQAIRRPLWCGVAFVSMGFAVLLMVLNPSRPLLPVPAIIEVLRLARVPAGAVAHLESNYSFRTKRLNGLAPLVAAIPPSETAIGVISGSDNPEIVLWQPFGVRNVVDVQPSTPLAASHLRYIVVGSSGLQFNYHMTIDELTHLWSAQVVKSLNLSFKMKRAAETYYLLRIPNA